MPNNELAKHRGVTAKSAAARIEIPPWAQNLMFLDFASEYAIVAVVITAHEHKQQELYRCSRWEHAAGVYGILSKRLKMYRMLTS